MLADVGPDKPPAEVDSVSMKAFLAALGNAHAGETVKTIGGVSGFIEAVDERRNHVIFVTSDYSSVEVVKGWLLESYKDKNAPLLPRLCENEWYS